MGGITVGRIRKFRTISLPGNLMDGIENFIREHPEKGYTSSAEFAKEAIRNELERQG